MVIELVFGYQFDNASLVRRHWTEHKHQARLLRVILSGEQLWLILELKILQLVSVYLHAIEVQFVQLLVIPETRHADVVHCY